MSSASAHDKDGIPERDEAQMRHSCQDFIEPDELGNPRDISEIPSWASGISIADLGRLGGELARRMAQAAEEYLVEEALRAARREFRRSAATPPLKGGDDVAGSEQGFTPTP